MNNLVRLTAIALLFFIGRADAQEKEAAAFQAVPELGYRVIPDFFHPQEGMNIGEASGVALNSKGHIFLFQRAKPMLTEYDESGAFLRSLGDGLFTHPHGLRIDGDDNLWTTYDGRRLVLKLSPTGHVLLVLGRKDVAAESDWLLNPPTDVAFGKSGEVCVSDGYGNSRVAKFDREGKFLKAWGKYGAGPGEFNLPHSIVVDGQGSVYVGTEKTSASKFLMQTGIFSRSGQALDIATDCSLPLTSIFGWSTEAMTGFLSSIQAARFLAPSENPGTHRARLRGTFSGGWQRSKNLCC